jgi:uncharacterized protein YlxW (UPF0749 family)
MIEPPGRTTPAAGYAADFLLDLFRNPLEPGYAEAARARAEGRATPPGWRRTGIRGARIVALLLTGFLLAVAYQHTVTSDAEASRAGLVADVRDRRAQTDDLQRRAEQLRDDVARARDQALGGDGDEVRRLRDLEAGAGLARVRGDGIVVTLGDAPPQVDPVTGKQPGDNPGRVLDRDLQDIANALWRCGAEAISVNGQRLAATSTIRSAGGAILVDFRPVAGPYQVAAIGPDDLDRTFGDSATAKRFRRYVEVYRMQFAVRRQSGLTLPAAPDPQLHFAHPPSGSPSASPVPSRTGGTR